MTNKLIQKARELGMRPTECNWFQYFAQETWDRIGYARTHKGLRIWETTITQNLIFEFHVSKSLYASSPMLPYSWGIDILEAVNERTNGNDIELFVDTADGVLFFAIQAKIINHRGFLRAGMVNGNYPNMNHVVGGQNQIELLCDYASDKGGIPIYLLYNFVKNHFSRKVFCNTSFEIEQYGCSIASANKIKTNYFNGRVWTAPTFNDLHPNNALPWFVIPCCFASKTKEQILEMLGEEIVSSDNITSYNLNEIRSDNNWKVFSPFNEKGTINGDMENNINLAEFNPKYRVIISKELSYRNKIK